jgi:hypothetical protein
MLGKEQPEGRQEWMKVMNFIAWNVDFRSCMQICSDIARSNHVPLRQREINEIVDFQTYNRATRDLASREQTATHKSEIAVAKRVA